MKILVLSDDFPPEGKGGSAVVAFNLAKSFLSKGHHVSVITTTQNKSFKKETLLEGLKVYKIFSYYHERWRAYVSLYNRQTIAQAKHIIADIKPDIVHAHNVHSHLSYHVFRLAKNSGAKVFLTVHDVMLYEYGKAQNESEVSWIKQLKENRFRYNPFRNLAIRYYLQFVDKIIVVSNSLKNALENNKINKTVIIYNGIDVKSYEASQEEVEKFRDKYRLNNKKVIFFGGRLSGAKGGEQIVLAMAKVIKNFPKAILLIAGKKNNYAEKMLELATNLGVNKNIIFTDWLDQKDLKLAYLVSDVVTFPSICFESFGMVALEAMACKKPVIGTCFGGTKEIVQENITGFIIYPFDIETLASKLSLVLSDPVLSEQFGIAGYERVKEIFSLEKQTSAYLKIFTVA